MVNLPEVVYSPLPPEGDDGQWEIFCERGRLAAQMIDAGRWTIGQDASALETKYGENIIGAYANEIDVRPKRVEEYRGVHRFYGETIRKDTMQEYPTLSYTHFRVAMRLAVRMKKADASEIFDALEYALMWLSRAGIMSWNAAAMEIEIGKTEKTLLPDKEPAGTISSQDEGQLRLAQFDIQLYVHNDDMISLLGPINRQILDLLINIAEKGEKITLAIYMPKDAP